jgi:hypothetical protein
MGDVIITEHGAKKTKREPCSFPDLRESKKLFLRKKLKFMEVIGACAK